MSKVFFYYDPVRQQFDTNLWSQLTGTTTFSTPNLVLNNTSMIQYADYFLGRYNIGVTIPAAPTSGDNRIIGLSDLGRGCYARFKITGAVFTCETKDQSGNTTSTTVPWDASWTNAAITMSIDWYGQGVSFKINNKHYATHELSNPRSPMSTYILNGNSDNLLLSFVEGLGIQHYI